MKFKQIMEAQNNVSPKVGPDTNTSQVHLGQIPQEIQQWYSIKKKGNSVLTREFGEIVQADKRGNVVMIIAVDPKKNVTYDHTWTKGEGTGIWVKSSKDKKAYDKAYDEYISDDVDDKEKLDKRVGDLGWTLTKRTKRTGY